MHKETKSGITTLWHSVNGKPFVAVAHDNMEDISLITPEIADTRVRAYWSAREKEEAQEEAFASRFPNAAIYICFGHQTEKLTFAKKLPRPDSYARVIIAESRKRCLGWETLA